MSTSRLIISLALLGGLIGSAPMALADKPSWAGGGKHERQERDNHADERQGRRDEGRHEEHRSRNDDGIGIDIRFDTRQRSYLYDYYAGQARQGHCPPGLAKKHNGCLPPGQAKKWSRGRPLPGDLTYYDLPEQVVLQIGRPPAGYRYVRVANDVLLVTVGTMMVVDALEDLGVLGAR